jgi:hypothetical protein
MNIILSAPNNHDFVACEKAILSRERARDRGISESLYYYATNARCRDASHQFTQFLKDLQRRDETYAINTHSNISQHHKAKQSLAAPTIWGERKGQLTVDGSTPGARSQTCISPDFELIEAKQYIFIISVEYLLVIVTLAKFWTVLVTSWRVTHSVCAARYWRYTSRPSPAYSLLHLAISSKLKPWMWPLVLDHFSHALIKGPDRTGPAHLTCCEIFTALWFMVIYVEENGDASFDPVQFDLSHCAYVGAWVSGA